MSDGGISPGSTKSVSVGRRVEDTSVQPEDNEQLSYTWRFSPNPWHIVATNGTSLATLSDLTLTEIRVEDQGHVYTRYQLSGRKRSDGFRVNQTGEVTLSANILNSQRGVINVVEYKMSLNCGPEMPLSELAVLNGDIGRDSAAVELVPGGRWYPCNAREDTGPQLSSSQ